MKEELEDLAEAVKCGVTARGFFVLFQCQHGRFSGRFDRRATIRGGSSGWRLPWVEYSSRTWLDHIF